MARTEPPARGRADLHLHSTASDGTDAPARVVERARAAGLSAIALTDHDTTEGLAEAAAAGRRLGVEVVAGIELSVDHEGREVHLLGYGFDAADDALVQTLAEFQAERSRRIERMVARLRALGLDVTLEDVRERALGPSIGRPHVADALVGGGHVPSYDVAWDEYLRPGGKAYVERRRLPMRQAVELVRRCGGVTSIAHPTLNLDVASIERAALASGVDALETAHPRISPEQARALSDLCRRHDLAETGGSDCHGSRRGGPHLGSVSISSEALARLRRPH